MLSARTLLQTVFLTLAVLGLAGTRAAQAQSVLYNTLGGSDDIRTAYLSAYGIGLGGDYFVPVEPIHLSSAGDAITSITVYGVHLGRDNSGHFVDTPLNYDDYSAQIFSSLDAARQNPSQGDLGGLLSSSITPYMIEDGHQFYAFTYTTATPVVVPIDFLISATTYSPIGGFTGFFYWSFGNSSARPGTIISNDSNNGRVIPGLGAKIEGNQVVPVPEASTTVSLGLLVALGLSGTLVAKCKKSKA